ncbi:MAG: glycosyltransferase [Lachnospiraceae bacterium]|nr:glycosyltransferase [Lachnospiraceae bacterium]
MYINKQILDEATRADILKPQNLTEIDFKKDTCYTVFGAGKAGKIIASYVINAINEKVIFCDNNTAIQDDDLNIPIYPVEKAAQIPNNIFLLGFMNNDTEKLRSAQRDLKDNGVNEDNIFVIDMASGIIDEAYSLELQKVMNMFNTIKIPIKRQLQRIEEICFVSYGFNESKEKNITGGPSGAICMQKHHLRDCYKGIKLCYPYFDDTKEQLLADRFPHITDAVIKARRLGQKKQNAIYIVNDIFSAFGLFLAGVNYLLIFHAQGDIVREMVRWGTNLSELEKKLFHDVEITTVRYANRVLFPSIGAEKYFRESFSDELEFRTGLPLYNTINEIPTIEPMEGIVRDDSYITFLSIGQMTVLKGMDRIPDFIKEYADYSGKKVRWICVADGVLKNQVRNQMEGIMKQNRQIDFVNIDSKVSHGKIFYLMNICDVYLMLHRVSIFDFSTLEAMYNRKPIILSNISGNDEFNKEDNIMLLEDDHDMERVGRYIDNRLYFGNLNYQVYQKYFSEEPFKTRYFACMDEFIQDVEIG